jgi:hypothetical protein
MARRYFVMLGRDSGATVVPKELREEEARAQHEAGEDVRFMDDDGVMHPVPRLVQTDPPEEAPKAKRAAKG